MKKNEIIKLLKPKCNGYDLPLSLNIEIIAEILVNKQEDEQLTLTDVVKSLPIERPKLTTSYNELIQLTLTDVSQRSKLLPEFLMHDLDGKIITSVIGSADVTKEWNEYLVNCG